MDEPKKITFGFSKVIKKPNLMAGKKPEEPSNKVELITSLEGNTIQTLE